MRIVPGTDCAALRHETKSPILHASSRTTQTWRIVTSASVATDSRGSDFPTRRRIRALIRVARHPIGARGSRHETRRYDLGMTKAKIAISLPRDQIARVHREVRAGRAGSVSGYIARVLAEQERRESLRELLQDLVEQHGEPSAKDIKWAERALEQRRG
jgi:hypothetical protein